jgi:hypothetical protein
MNDNPYFHLWVAKNLDLLGGFGAAYLQGVQREQALTYAEIRIAACQYDFRSSDERFSLDPMRSARLGAAHMMTIH